MVMDNGSGRNAGAAKAPLVYIGVPTHDNRWHTMFCMSLINLVGSNRFNTVISKISSGGIHKARNTMAWEFLKNTKADYFLSIDSDIEFHPDHVSRLLSRNLPIVAGPYCHKKPQTEWSARSIEGIPCDPRTGLQKMCAVGMGFCLIKREVFEKILLQDQPPLRAIGDWSHEKGQEIWDIFWEGIMTEPGYYNQPTQLTEDFGFCYRARKAGYDIYVDTTFYVKHWDNHQAFPADAPPSIPIVKEVAA